MGKKRKWYRTHRVVPVSDLKKIPPGPLRHKRGLSLLLRAIARELYQRVGHYVRPSFEQWELGFMRDMHPWREILIWEAICRAYEAYLAEHPETADHKWIIGMLSGIAMGVFWKETEPEQIIELRQLFEEARRQRWTPLLKTSVEFPQDGYLLLQYEDIVDEHRGTVDPRLNRALDPRQALADAQVILGCDNGQTSTPFLLFGREFMEKAGGRVRPGMRILEIPLDAKNTVTYALEKMLAIVKGVKGRHDYPWIDNDAEPEGVGGGV